MFGKSRSSLGLRVCLFLYTGVLVVSYLTWSGAFDSSGVLLSYPLTSPL